MQRFAMDFTNLDNQISKKRIKLDDNVKSQIEVFAFDTVRFTSPDKGAQLWQVQSADDGDYIVALYDEEELEKQASANYWKVSIAFNSFVEISYKNDPIIRLSHSKLGIPASELNQVASYLPTKLASNTKLVKALFKELGTTAQQEVLKRYPELTKVVS